MPMSFRDEVAAWFAKRTPRGWQAAADGMTDAEWLKFQRRWLQALNTVGYGAPHVPVAWGGGGFGVREQAVIYEEACRADAPPLRAFTVSLHHVPATLLRAGTAEQRERYVRDAVNGTVWCQGFSEPEAGSDLAALRTTARPVSDGYRVNGHKIWSSNAHLARWCLLLARTDPDAPRHQGISYLILDMSQPGVDAHPIRTATGHTEFCEIFLDDVFVPSDALIGAENDGWNVAQRTLATERGPIAVETIERMSAGIDRLARELPETDRARPMSHEAALAAELIAQSMAVRSIALDAVNAIERGDDMGSLSSLIKIASSDLLRRGTDVRTLFAGASSVIDPEHRHPRGWSSEHAMSDWVNSWAWSIAGGTNEIQRNIIAERMLGLPKEPRRP